MCVLSKRWKLVVDSFPILDFDWRDFGEDLVLTPLWPGELPELIDYLLGETLPLLIDHVDTSLFRFSMHKFSLQRFKLYICLPDLNLASILDKWVQLAIENGVEEVYVRVQTPGLFHYYKYDLYRLPKSIFAATSITVLSLWECDMELEESFCIKLHSLKKLALWRVAIRDHVLRKLVNCCPLIEDIALNDCSGLEKVQLFGLPRLMKFDIWSYMEGLKSIEIASASLESSYFSLEHIKPIIKMDACQCLKILSIYGSVITDQLFQDFDSKFPILENFIVNDCQTLKRIRISSCSLKWLSISSCHDIEDIEINTPNLLACYFHGSVLPFSLINAPSCQWKFDFVLGKSIGVSWFLKLKEFEEKLNQLVYLHIYIQEAEISLDLEDLSTNTSPSVIEVVLLTVDPTYPVSSYHVFMDGLFLCCHPKNLLIRSRDGQNTYVEYLTEFLERGDLSCCNHENVKCWRHYLKEMKIESSEENPGRMFPQNRLFWYNTESCTRCKMEWQI